MQSSVPILILKIGINFRLQQFFNYFYPIIFDSNMECTPFEVSQRVDIDFGMCKQ